MNQSLVTLKQAELLRSIGFKEPTGRYAWRPTIHVPFRLQQQREADVVSYTVCDSKYYMVVPTVDQACDFIRRKYHIMISNTSHPFVSPINHRIEYAYTVKYCDEKLGWNFREILGFTNWSANYYAAKRNALNIAIRYIIKKKKDAARRRANKNRRKHI